MVILDTLFAHSLAISQCQLVAACHRILASIDLLVWYSFGFVSPFLLSSVPVPPELASDFTLSFIRSSHLTSAVRMSYLDKSTH